MDPISLLIGFLLAGGRRGADAVSPAQALPPLPPAPGPTPAPPAQAAPAAPAPPVAPPAAAPAPPVAQVPFPVEVPQHPQAPPAGLRKALEVFRINPSGPMQLPQAALSDEASLVREMERRFPAGWRASIPTPASEIERAKTLLGQWVNGRVLFEGPLTIAGRRAFKMTQHPVNAPPPGPVVAHPAAAPPAAPTPAPQPQPPIVIPEVVITPSEPAAPAVPVVTPGPSVLPVAQVIPAVHVEPAAPSLLVTTVRRGEGLANVCKRLGQPATAKCAAELRAVNLPQSADGKQRKAIGMEKGGIQPVLQPGDRLFVPPAWGAIDPALL